MKKILVLLATAFMAVACFKGGTVNISGVANKAVKELGNAHLILTDQYGNTLDPIQVNADGTFSTSFNADATKGYSVSVECDGKILYDNIGTIIAEPGDLTVNFSSGRFYVTGGKINEQFEDVVKAYEKINKEKFDRYLTEQFNSKNNYEKAAFKKEDNKIVSKEIYKKVFSKNSSNFIGLKYFEESVYDGTIDNIDTFNKFYKKCKKFIADKSFYEVKRTLLAAESETSEFKQFKDIIGHEITGAPIRLSETVNSLDYTILYFWDPKNAIGINVIPYFEVVSEKFSENVTLIGCIPSYNTSGELAKFAISGKQILVDDFNAELTKYGIEQPPYSFIISKDGKILKRNLTGTELVEYIVETLKN